MKKEAALSRIVEQRMNKEAVEAENAANNAKLAEHLVHVRPRLSACRVQISELMCPQTAEVPFRCLECIQPFPVRRASETVPAGGVPVTCIRANQL